MIVKSSRIAGLERSLHALVHLGDNDTYIDVEDLVRLNREIRSGIESVYPLIPDDIEEDARICVVLLRAYGNLMCQDERDDCRRQSLLDRSSRLLKKLPSSLLRCKLLVYCYSEVCDPELAHEAHSIMSDWSGRELTEEEQEVMDTFRMLEETE